VRAVGAVELRYADEHVPLAMLLGAISALGALRRVLPAHPGQRDPAAASTPPDPFLSLLLGAVVIHDRLLQLCAAALAHEPVPRPDTPPGPTDDDGILR